MRNLIAAACLVALAGSAQAATADDHKADVDAYKAADRDCPNDGEHNLARDANDETKWVCIRDK